MKLMNNRYKRPIVPDDDDDADYRPEAMLGVVVWIIVAAFVVVAVLWFFNT